MPSRLVTAVRTHAVLAICVAGGLLGAGIVFRALSQPHGLYGLTEFDDGVYFASALRFVDGTLPYRDFTFVQPPGITLALSPFALLAHLTGTREAMAIARIAMGVVAGANAFLAGWLVRHRGVIATVIAGVGLAIFPSAYFADHTTLIEPFLVLFCLLGAHCVFRRGALRSARWCAIGGACFAIATTMKLWGIVPLVVAALCCAEKPLKRCIGFVSGAVVTGIVLCAPFLIAAPRAFIDDIFTAQLQRNDLANATPLAQRLWSLLGLRGYSLSITYHHHARYLIVVGGVITAIVIFGGISALKRKSYTTSDVFFLASALSVMALLLLPSDYFTHYAYFFAPFLVCTLGCAASHIADGSLRLLHATRHQLANRATSQTLTGAGIFGGIAMLVALVVWLVPTVRGEMRYDRSALRHAAQNFSVVSAAIPAGSCVLTDAPGIIIEANRFFTTDHTCPVIVDADGTWLANDPGVPEGTQSARSAKLEGIWLQMFTRATYVELSSPATHRIPWTPVLHTYFKEHFVLLHIPAAIYRRIPTAVIRPNHASHVHVA